MPQAAASSRSASKAHSTNPYIAIGQPIGQSSGAVPCSHAAAMLT